MVLRILHLSDLHISSNEDNNHKLLRDNIVKYVGEHVHNIDALVFTGDLIDRNDETAFPIGEEFISDLMKSAGLTAEQLIIVPGNHDMRRSQAVNRILEPAEITADNYYEENWDYLKVRMSGYANFIAGLGLAEAEDTEAYGYGVKTLEKEGKTICFNLLNSAWSSKGNEDYANLAIGRWQLEHNRTILQNIPNKALVITVMHHPLSWFLETERDMLQDYILNENKLGSHVLLHGHIHDVGMENAGNPSGSFASLISGIGYPKADEREAGQSKIADCRFSIYEIEVDTGEIDCFCLKSIETGGFVPDTTLYSGSQDGHYYIGWKSKNGNGNAGEVKRNAYMELDPVPLTSCWTGRAEELRLLAHSETNAIVISGVGGQGKTALAAEFFRNGMGERTFDKRLWVDCRELSDTMHSKLLQLQESLTGGAEKELAYKDELLKDTIRRFINHIREQRILVVFDNIDAYVDLKEEELVGELKDIIELALTEQNDSLLVMTCRIPIYNSKANFRNIKLDGLKEPEGIAYFMSRGIDLTKEEDMEACKAIVRITKGHPWWLGLIAGQMIAGKMQPREYLEQNQEEILSNSSQLEQYFGAIWKSLGSNKKGEIAQLIIRYLAEAGRPLSVNELSIVMDVNYNQTSKAFKMLLSLSLLIEHNDKEKEEKLYQVHPLVREYVHKNYSMEAQKPLVNGLVEWFMGKRNYEALFGEVTAIVIEESLGQCSTENIMVAMETWLNAGNCEDALKLLVYFYENLLREGYCAEVLLLGRRILDNIDWIKTEITTIKVRADFLCQYLDLLVYHQEGSTQRVLNYLAKYERCCEKNTLPYSGYLGARVNTMWRLGRYHEAELALKEYEEMEQKHSDVWFVTDMANLKGMLLRECGHLEEALCVFESNSESNARYGNIARCYQLMGRYEEALDWMRDCLEKLNRGTEMVDRVNKGYAYLWISEIYYTMNEFDKAKVFLILCQETWKEYAPGLLRLTTDMMKKLEQLEIELPLEAGQRMLGQFMDRPSQMESSFT